VIDLKHALQNTQNDCYQWLSEFSNSSRVQIRFRLGLCPGPHWGAYRSPDTPDPVAGLRGPTSNGRRWKETVKEGRGGEKVGKRQRTREWKGRGRDARRWKRRRGEGRKKDRRGGCLRPWSTV